MTQKNYCPRCGEAVDPSARYCPRCGAPLSAYDGGQGVTPAFYANDAFATGPAGISRGIAAVLAIIGGAFGVQYFYTRKTTAGIICLVVSLCTCCTIGGILGIIQGIYMLMQTNEQFYRTYVDTQATFPLF